MSNGCGGEGGFDFEILKDKLTTIKYFDKEKIDSLYQTIEAKCCIPHDKLFTEGGGIVAFIKANLKFSYDLYLILHWSNKRGRIGAAVLAFIGLTIFGGKHFNWK